MGTIYWFMVDAGDGWEAIASTSLDRLKLERKDIINESRGAIRSESITNIHARKRGIVVMSPPPQ